MKKVQWPDHKTVLSRIDDDWKTRIKLESVNNGVLKYKYHSKSGRIYDISLKREGNDILSSCTCPYGSKKTAKKPCKHVMAAVLSLGREEVEGERIVLWPSSVDMITLCPASRVTDNDNIIIDRIGDMANVGRAVHSAAEMVVKGEDIESAEEIATKYNVEEYRDDISYLISAVKAAWKQLQRYFQHPFTEKKISLEYNTINPYTHKQSSVILSGRIDVGEIFEDELSPYAVALDWKTGRKNDDSYYIGQMKAYASLMFADNDNVDTVNVMIVWLRSREFTSIKFTREEIRHWLASFVRHNVFWDGKTYHPGAHCAWCSRFYDCPARKKEMSSAIELFTGKSDVVDPDAMYHGYKFAKAVIKTAQEFIDQIKAETRKRGAIVIPGLGDDKGFIIKKRSGRQIVRPDKARPLLEEYIGKEGVDSISTIGLARLKKALLEAAPPGDKKGFLNQVLQKLVDSGGIVKARDAEYLTVGTIEGEDNG